MLGQFRKVSVIGAAILAAEGSCWKERMKIEGEEAKVVEVKPNKEDSSWFDSFYWLFGLSCPEGQVCDENHASNDLFLNDVDNKDSMTEGEEHVVI